MLNGQTLLEFALVKRMVWPDEYVSGHCISPYAYTYTHQKVNLLFRHSGLAKKLLLLLMQTEKGLAKPLAIGLGRIHVFIHISVGYTSKSFRLGHSSLLLAKQRPCPVT